MVITYHKSLKLSILAPVRRPNTVLHFYMMWNFTQHAGGKCDLWGVGMSRGPYFKITARQLSMSLVWVYIYFFVPSRAWNETWYQSSDSMSEFEGLFCISLSLLHCWGGAGGWLIYSLHGRDLKSQKPNVSSAEMLQGSVARSPYQWKKPFV